MKNYQCQNCKKDFNIQEVYRWGKDRYFFCHECNEKNKKKCSWCEKDLNCPSDKFKVCYLHSHRKRHRWDNDGSSEYEYEVFCDEKCQSKFDKYQKNTPEKVAERQKAQELLNKGHKRCDRIIIPFEPVKTSCGNLIPPTEKCCESCKEIEKKEKYEREKRKEREKELAKIKKDYAEKYQKAQSWWSSLNEEEKKKQLNDLEEKWKKEGWHTRLFDGKNSLEFKNGKIYYDNLGEVPPPLLENFGISCDYSEYTHRGNKFVSLNDELQERINNLERKLQEAKKSGNKTEIDNLEKEIKDLKNPTGEKSPTTSPKHSYWPWIIGISLVSLIIAIGFWIVKKSLKIKKICQRKN